MFSISHLYIFLPYDLESLGGFANTTFKANWSLETEWQRLPKASQGMNGESRDENSQRVNRNVVWEFV